MKRVSTNQIFSTYDEDFAGSIWIKVNFGLKISVYIFPTFCSVCDGLWGFQNEWTFKGDFISSETTRSKKMPS